MHKNYYKYLIVGIVAICLTACMSKENYLSDFDNFVSKTAAKTSSSSKDDWSISDSMFLDFAKVKYDKFSSKLNEKDKAKVLELTGKYAALRVKSGANQFLESIKGFGIATESFIKELNLDSISLGK